MKLKGRTRTQMRILQINATSGIGSTGRVCENISRILFGLGVDNVILYSEGSSDYKFSYKIGNSIWRKFCGFFSKITGNFGFTNYLSTNLYLKFIKKYKPDVIYLHNIHCNSIHLAKFFDELNKIDTKIVWSFDDCWPFTGYCTHFMYSDCHEWRSCCHKCNQRKQFSYFFDKSIINFKRKKKIADSNRISIIAGSKWMKKQIEESIFKKSHVETLYYGLKLDDFYPLKTNIKEKLGIESNKKIVLGVSMFIDKKKGMDFFVELSKRLDDRFVIILVGEIDKTYLPLPRNIVHLSRTKSKDELRNIYSCADVFFNPTLADTFGMTNIESLACGTPVITFNNGGVSETIDSESGFVVDGDINEVLCAIDRICFGNSIDRNNCVKRAKMFDENKCLLDISKHLIKVGEAK